MKPSPFDPWRRQKIVRDPATPYGFAVESPQVLICTTSVTHNFFPSPVPKFLVSKICDERFNLVMSCRYVFTR